jgi:hypothetical protein
MSDYWPLLDLHAALKDADRALADAADVVTTMQGGSDGHFPPDAPLFLASVETLRCLLREVVPQRLAEAIADEQRHYDEEEAR